MFSNSSAAGGGGVMGTSNSSFNIISSIFISNNAPHGSGGVTYADASSFNIVDSIFMPTKLADTEEQYLPLKVPHTLQMALFS